jgi:hypothetical protein
MKEATINLLFKTAEYPFIMAGLVVWLLAVSPGFTANPPFVAAMSEGTSGDLHWMDYSKPKKENYGIDQYAAELADIAFGAYQKIDYNMDTSDLAMTETVITLNRRHSTRIVGKTLRQET